MRIYSLRGLSLATIRLTLLQQAEQGTQVAEVPRKIGISEHMFYRWKKKLKGLMPTEVRKLRQLEE